MDIICMLDGVEVTSQAVKDELFTRLGADEAHRLFWVVSRVGAMEMLNRVFQPPTPFDEFTATELQTSLVWRQYVRLLDYHLPLLESKVLAETTLLSIFTSEVNRVCDGDLMFRVVVAEEEIGAALSRIDPATLTEDEAFYQAALAQLEPLTIHPLYPFMSRRHKVTFQELVRQRLEWLRRIVA